ncbi:alpha/beta hydrolase [Actinoallomurus vinaceus]|uniref:Alpha/beta hydrolase n=1 Tax=Actinoallomurus vinaceus TaxID=1080074 RepID=A0ABP8UEE9_9ACTN
MTHFTSYDGTTLAYRTIGEGPPLVCLAGGPGRAAEYLGDLGAPDRTLIMLDTRGTGASEMPRDLSTCRVDRLVRDVEALRGHLGLEHIDVFGHSAGGGVALLYAATHPDRLDHLVLANPSLHAIGLESDLGADKVIAARSAEPWYESALEAYRRVREAATFAEAARYRLAFEPLMYGRWDATAQAHAASDPAQRSLAVSENFYAGYRPDVETLHTALAAVGGPVLVLAGEVDLWPTAEAAEQAIGLFPRAELVVQPGSGHYPWLDDPGAFAAALDAFLG